MCSEDEDKSVRSFATSYSIICSFFFNWGAVLSIVDGGKIVGCSNSATQQWFYCRYFTIFCAK